MKLLNCDSANKMVRQLQADCDALLAREREVSAYSYLEGETPEVPEYDFEQVQSMVEEYHTKIVRLKHAINTFNVNTTLPDVGMTVDAALVRMAMLNSEKRKLDRMRNTLAKTRTTTMRGVSEHFVRNYDAKQAQARYEAVCKELIAIQQAINFANLTMPIEVDID